MKYLQSILLIIFSSVLFTLSCDNSTSGDTEYKILGEWVWMQSSGGWTGGTINPDSVGYTIKLVFEEDGVYKEYKNNSLTLTSHYIIEKKPYGSNDNQRDYLIIENHHVEQLVEFEKSTSLKLIENCMDCYVHNYIKESFF